MSDKIPAAYLEIGRIVSVHGLKGEVKVYPWCDSPEIICGLSCLYLGNDKNKLIIEKSRTLKNMAVVKFKAYDTPEAANTMRNKILYVKREDLELDDNEFFIDDIIGMTVFDADTGKEYGKIFDVMQTGANDVYCLRGKGGRELYVPALPDVISEVNTEEGRMLIRPLKGLFDED